MLNKTIYKWILENINGADEIKKTRIISIETYDGNVIENIKIRGLCGEHNYDTYGVEVLTPNLIITTYNNDIIKIFGEDIKYIIIDGIKYENSELDKLIDFITETTEEIYFWINHFHVNPGDLLGQ